jgi:hypothetical protein
VTSRLIRAVAAMAMASALVSAPVACAGQEPDPPIPPGTLVLGPVQITPSILLKDMGLDENVFNDPVDPKRDFTLTLAPSAQVRFRMRRLRLAYLTSTEYVYYRKYATERGTNTSSSVRMDLDLGLLKPYGTVSGLNSKARLNTEVDERARHRDLSYGAGIALKVASRTHLLINGAQTTVAFEPDAEFRGIELDRSFDGRRRGIDVGISLALTPLTTFGVALAREEQRFDRSPERDSTSWRVTPGFTFSPTGVLTGSASVGYRRFQPVSPTVPEYSGLVSAVTVGATLYGRHQLQVLFSRDVQYSYETANAYYVGTGGSMTWTLSVVGPIDVRGTAGRIVMDYSRLDAQAGHDTTSTYGGGLGYRFSSRARLGVNAEWSRRDSNRSAERGYRNHRIFAGLTWGTS